MRVEYFVLLCATRGRAGRETESTKARRDRPPRAVEFIQNRRHTRTAVPLSHAASLSKAEIQRATGDDLGSRIESVVGRRASRKSVHVREFADGREGRFAARHG